MSQILLLDIETTNFQNKGGKIVEIGIAELDTETGDIKKLFDEVTHEDGITRKEVENSWIVKNSDLTVEMIRTSKNLKHYKKVIQEILYRHFKGCTAYNNVFDFGFMGSRGLIFPKRLPCPMKLMTPVCKIPSSFKKNDYKWPTAQESYDFLFPGTGYVEKHRAYDDAHHEAEIVFELIKRGVFIFE